MNKNRAQRMHLVDKAMRLIDEKYLLHPWLGVPRMTTWLRKDKGYRINPKPNTSKRGKGFQHRIYKYLLRGLKVERRNQVWAMDITYITEQYGTPEILNTDQGSQFTAYEFCDWVTHPNQGIRLSMDGKGRAIDNIFIERLWRSVKYEHVCLFPASDGLECYQGLKTYFEYYNNERRHQSLEDEIPVEVYHRAKQKEVA